MSIYGPNVTSAHESDDCTSKKHIDTQVSLRVMKTGDAMTGDLNMGGNLVRGLPTEYPPTDYQGDEAPSWFQVVRLTQEAANNDSTQGTGRKPIIAVWAEENGGLSANEYEFSFGNGVTTRGYSGYPMLVPGKVIRMGLLTTPQDKRARVGLVVNGTAVPERVVSKSATQTVGIVSWGAAYELAPGDCINFKTLSADLGIQSAVVSLLIELDI